MSELNASCPAAPAPPGPGTSPVTANIREDWHEAALGTERAPISHTWSRALCSRAPRLLDSDTSDSASRACARTPARVEGTTLATSEIETRWQRARGHARRRAGQTIGRLARPRPDLFLLGRARLALAGAGLGTGSALLRAAGLRGCLGHSGSPFPAR